MIRACRLSQRHPLRRSDVYGAPSTFRFAGLPALPGLQALDDDVSSVTVAESLGRTDCAGCRAWLGTTTRKDLLNRAWLDRQVHKDRIGVGLRQFPASGSSEGTSWRRWADRSYDGQN